MNEAASNHPAFSTSPQQLESLRIAAGAGPVLILTHDNPDPDSLASGKALAILLQKAWQIPADLRYGGLVARVENKAVLRLLTPEWQPVEPGLELSRYSAIALVDTQPGAGNNSLSGQFTPQIVIDHHLPLRENLRQVQYMDIRPEVGATVSIITQYLQVAGVDIDPVLATAIFYGIQADTRSLSRGASPLDWQIYRSLFEGIDRQLLIQIEQARLPRQYYQAFSKGLRSARLYGNVIFVYMGALHRADFVAEMADIFVRLEKIRAVMCLGHHGGVMQISLRTVDPQDDAGALAQQVAPPLGTAGGHGMAAGGQVQLGERDPDQIAGQIEERFLSVMGEISEGEPLLI